jgi:hypothetical protein
LPGDPEAVPISTPAARRQALGAKRRRKSFRDTLPSSKMCSLLPEGARPLAPLTKCQTGVVSVALGIDVATDLSLRKGHDDDPAEL